MSSSRFACNTSVWRLILALILLVLLWLKIDHWSKTAAFEKAYVCLFTCASTRRFHLELTLLASSKEIWWIPIALIPIASGYRRFARSAYNLSVLAIGIIGGGKVHRPSFFHCFTKSLFQFLFLCQGLKGAWISKWLPFGDKSTIHGDRV